MISKKAALYGACVFVALTAAIYNAGDRLGAFHLGPSFERFESEQWRNSKSYRVHDARDSMKSDVLDNVLKEGMPVAEVVRLLGTPDDDLRGKDLTSYEREQHLSLKEADEVFGYVTKRNSPLLDSGTDFLRIAIDQGKVLHAWLSPDEW